MPPMSVDTSLIDSFPFSSHLKYNYIPSDEEVVQIRAFLLNEPRKQLEEIKAEIDRVQLRFDSPKPTVDYLQAELGVLGLKFDNLHQQFASCAALITFPRRLPYDVLGEIFYQTLPKDRNALLRYHSVPLTLTRVCRHWRQVAFSTPRLWSTMHVNVMAKHRSPCSRPFIPLEISLPDRLDELQATAASEWLKRAGNLPLHFSFTANMNQQVSPAILDLYLRYMIPFSSRWKSLVLEGLSTSFSRISTLNAADLRSLESVILDFDPMEQGAWISSRELIYTWSKCGIFTSSSLRKLSIRRVTPMDLTALSVDWSQLTHLELGAPPERASPATILPMSTASQILQASTRLVDCQIRISGWEDAPHISLMQLPLLRSLSIRMEGPILSFTAKLKVPALQTLGLHIVEDMIRGPSIDYSACLAPLFQYEQGSIQKLVIDIRYLDHDSFLEMLRKCPDLKSLRLNLDFDSVTGYRKCCRLFRIDDEFLERISANHSDILCSQLEEFLCHIHANISATGMVEFVKRKQHGSVSRLAKLKKVAILPYAQRKSLESVLSGELQPYISQGLTFHLLESGRGGHSHSYADFVEYGNSAIQYADS